MTTTKISTWHIKYFNCLLALARCVSQRRNPVLTPFIERKDFIALLSKLEAFTEYARQPFRKI